MYIVIVCVGISVKSITSLALNSYWYVLLMWQINDNFVCLFVFFRGFAFVVFSSPDAVEEVMKNLPHTIDGRTVDAKRAIPHAIHQVCKEMVGGLPSLKIGLPPPPCTHYQR